MSFDCNLEGGGDRIHYQHEHDPSTPLAMKYSLVSLNIESAHTQFDKLVTYGAADDNIPDIMLICEHRIADTQQAAFRRRFADQGWNLHACPAPAENSRTHAGVCPPHSIWSTCKSTFQGPT